MSFGTRIDAAGHSSNPGVVQRTGRDDQYVTFTVQIEPGLVAKSSMTKTDFIAAVETELNGTFISHDDLPEVTGPEGTGYVVCDGNEYFHSDVTRKATRETAMRLLAVANYLDTHPPVDQKQVDALASSLLEGLTSGKTVQDIARTLIATGKVSVTVK